MRASTINLAPAAPCLAAALSAVARSASFNLCSAFRELGIEPEPLPSSLSFFMNADVAPDGRLSLLAPRTRAGAAITVRAEMDLLTAGL